VNHDLIAAGHPRLNFEFGAYHANLPKHWNEQKDKAGRPDFEARAWAIGQIVTAKSALELLAWRANPANNTPWPEFAEYDCFACHHDLQAKSWRQSRDVRGRKPGALTCGSWYMSMLPRAVEAIGGDKDSSLGKLVDRLRAELQRPAPDRVLVGRISGELVCRLGELETQAGNAIFNTQQLAEIFETIDKGNDRRWEDNWDSAAQGYLGLAALYHARKELNRAFTGEREEQELKQMVEKLRFPSPFDSPHTFGPSGVKNQR
jgi:hypothetical protein